MKINNIEKIIKEINKKYIPYWEITFDFVKAFAEKENIILSEEEISYILEQFKKKNDNVLLELNEDVVPYNKEINVLDWTDKFETVPTLQEVRAYIKKLVDEGIKFATIEKYHYFRSRVKIGLTEYRIILHTEQYVGESEEKPQTVHLYDVLETSKKTSKPKSL